MIPLGFNVLSTDKLDIKKNVSQSVTSKKKILDSDWLTPSQLLVTATLQPHCFGYCQAAT